MDGVEGRDEIEGAGFCVFIEAAHVTRCQRDIRVSLTFGFLPAKLDGLSRQVESDETALWKPSCHRIDRAAASASASPKIRASSRPMPAFQSTSVP